MSWANIFLEFQLEFGVITSIVFLFWANPLWMVPTLTAADVASRVIRSIENRDYILMTPRIMYLLHWVSSITPQTLQCLTLKFMNGHRFLKDVLKVEWSRRVPILMIIGNDTASDDHFLRELSLFISYISKCNWFQVGCILESWWVNQLFNGPSININFSVHKSDRKGGLIDQSFYSSYGHNLTCIGKS